jgi:hypothetical protein
MSHRLARQRHHIFEVPLVAYYESCVKSRLAKARALQAQLSARPLGEPLRSSGQSVAGSGRSGECPGVR